MGFKMHIPDIDIDIKDRNDVLSILKHHPASMIDENKQTFKKHPTGVYFECVPFDPLTSFCSIDYKIMEQLGFHKIDLLHNNVYKEIPNRETMLELLNKSVRWELFKEKDVVSKLFQLSNHFDIVNQYPPQSIDDVAILIALIRPGKKHLVGCNWITIKNQIWKKNVDDEYSFKKSHAFGYAHVIILQLNMLCYMENLNGIDYSQT